MVNGDQKPLIGHDGATPDFAISKSGDYCATVGFDGKIIRWNLATLERTWELRVHTRPVHAVRFSPDGTIGASLDWDGHCAVWRISDGSLLCEIEAGLRKDSFSDIAFHSTEPILVITGNGGIGFWDYRNGNQLGFQETKAYCRNPQFSSDGKLLFYTSRRQEKEETMSIDVLTLPPMGYGLIEATRKELGIHDQSPLTRKQRSRLSIE